MPILQDAEMEEPEVQPSTSQPERTSTPATTVRKPRRKLLPAPIESLNEFQVADYLRDLPCGLSVGQAAHEIPKYRAGLNRAVRRTREKDVNLVDNDNTCTSAAKCTLRV